jgi:hypothetical protein
MLHVSHWRGVQILALIAVRNRGLVLGRTNRILEANKRMLDAFFSNNTNAFQWSAPPAGSVAFPSLISSESVRPDGHKVSVCLSLATFPLGPPLSLSISLPLPPQSLFPPLCPPPPLLSLCASVFLPTVCKFILCKGSLGTRAQGSDGLIHVVGLLNSVWHCQRIRTQCVTSGPPTRTVELVTSNSHLLHVFTRIHVVHMLTY